MPNTLMKRSLIALVLFCSLAAPARAADIGYASSLAGRMMALMWEAMVWFFSGVPAGYGVPAWGSGWGPHGPSPQGLHPGWNWSSGHLAESYGPGPVGLNGIWYSQAGEWLAIEGDRFRLGTENRAVDGHLRLTGDRMITRVAGYDSLTEYRFARSGDLLVLGDRFGRTLMFRRVR